MIQVFASISLTHLTKQYPLSPPSLVLSSSISKNTSKKNQTITTETIIFTPNLFPSMKMMMGTKTITNMKYWLTDHPTIVGFRWNHSQSWGSTWSFLFTSIASYIILSTFLHLVLTLFRRRRPVPLGPIPAIHSLFMALVSLTIFFGLLFSTVAEIRDTRWFWRRSKTPLQWLFCFPLGTRPTGRVFFWSYIFYLSRFVHLLRTFFTILRYRKLSFFRIFNQSILICMSFLWLEFSQSFQVMAILSTTLVYSIVYVYRFWVGIGLGSACFPFVVHCQMLLLACNLVFHVGVLVLHFMKGGCNGIGAWVFNSVFNVAILIFILNYYVKMRLTRRKAIESVENNQQHPSSSMTTNSTTEVEKKVKDKDS